MDAPPRRSYVHPMGRRRFHCFAAVVAAYALALQALIAAFVVPGNLALATLDPSVTCQSKADSGGPAAPAMHDPCLACTAGHCFDGMGGDPRLAAYLPWPRSGDRAATLHDGVAFAVAFAPDRLHSPRAPPAG